MKIKSKKTMKARVRES